MKKAEEKLLASPFIAKASVFKQRDGALLIDYTVRTPFFLIADYENLAVDAQGFFFPIQPFFSPKQLPELYLGSPCFKGWKSRLQGKQFDVALQVLSQFPKETQVRRIDLSLALAPSLGRREVVVQIQEGGEVHYLRLTTKQYSEELLRYGALRREFQQSGKSIPQVIDLRIPNLAFTSSQKASSK